MSEASLYRVFLLAALALLAACSGKSEVGHRQDGKAQVGVVIARRTAVPVAVSLPARLEAVRHAEVRARVAGIVVERLYAEGQEVRKGAPLFRIDPAPFQAAHDAAAAALARVEAQSAFARDKLERYTDLVTDKAVSDRDYIEAQAEDRLSQSDVAAARAQLERARLELSYATVTAPIAGRARRALVTEGALVGQDAPTPLTVVEQIDPIYANFAQPASEVMALQRAMRSGAWQGIAVQDMPIRLLLPDGTEYAHAGALVFSDLAVDPTTDTVAMRAAFPNPQRELMPGAYVQVSFDRALEPTAVLVPRDALLRSANAAHVRVVNAQNVVEEMTVTADRMLGAQWVISAGLDGGERVIVENVSTTAPGTHVAAVNVIAGQEE